MSGAARGALRRFAAALASDQSPLASSNRAALAAVGTHLMRRGRSLSSKPAEFTFGDEDQARRYDDALASQVFRPWCEAMVEINEPVPGNKVLDLACGTGINTMLLASRVGDKVPGGQVVGVDVSRGMLAVAEAKAKNAHHAAPASDGGPDRGLAPVTFHFGDACAEDTPWHEPFRGRFHRAYCHQGLQFMPDPTEALNWVRSSLAPGGQFTCSVWAPIEHQPLFLAVHRALCGPDVNKPEWGETLLAPFAWNSNGDTRGSHAEGVRKLEDALARAGFDAPDAAVERGYVYFANADAAADVVRAAPFWPELIADESLHERYVRAVSHRLAEAESELGGFARVDVADVADGGWGVVEAAKKSGGKGDGDLMAIPAVAYFGHATAPWNVLGTKG